MLDELAVHNLGVLEEARLEPGPGLTVITGETGAGKTLLLGALRLLLGGVAASDLVGPFGEEASAQGRFLTPDGSEVAVGRRLSRTGRSRAYLDGAFASAAALDRATEGLVEIIGQHDHLGLTRTVELRRMLDIRLDGPGSGALGDYRQTWERLQRLLADRERLGGNRQALDRELDLLEYQAGEIARAGFRHGEDRELEAVLTRLRNVEELRDHVSGGQSGVAAARDAVGTAVGRLRRAAALDPDLESVAADVAGLEDRLGQAAVDLSGYIEDLEADPHALDRAEERMTVLGDLRRKYGPDLEDVLRFGAEATERATTLRDLVGRADRLDAEIDGCRDSLAELGDGLREARLRAADSVAAEAVGHLTELGFTAPILRIEVDRAPPSSTGADDVRFLFASDDRLTPGDIGRVASGGELSRLVLALRLAGGTETASTLVFDEVDAGVGGATALALAQKLAGLAEERQVLCVTHLPQIAAVADTHYVVRRDEIRAGVELVEGPERVSELTRMLAGLPDSERGRQAAEELLERAARG